MYRGTNSRNLRLVEFINNYYVDSYTRIDCLGEINTDSVIKFSYYIILKNFKLYDLLPTEICTRLFDGTLIIFYEGKSYYVSLIETRFVEQNERLLV